jgi:translocation protein SEC63
MSSFGSTFTKDKEQEEQLGYDDTAFYYFAGAVLLVIAIPWTFNTVYNLLFPGAEVEKSFPAKTRTGSTYRYCKTATMVDKVDSARRDARKCTNNGAIWFILRMVLLAGLWISFALIIVRVSDAKEIKRFDPFEILEITSSADKAEIKKAYRKLSLQWHPDKNVDDPNAAAKFIQITKAHAALTDEMARANFEKYGNPDGPTASKVGIGLPRFLLAKENHLMILSFFFFLLLFVIPATFICYYQRTKNYAANGVMIETLQFMGYYINESTRVKNCPELLAASAESRGMMTRQSDNAAMKPVAQHVVEHKKRQFNQPIITKNGYLIWAHMQRLHHLMSPELKSDTDELLKYSVKITQAMIEIACMREWFFTAQSMIEFKRSLIQALDLKSSQLLQIPHFNEEVLKHCHRGKNAVSSINDFLSKDPEQRKGLAQMETQQLMDIEAFCSHVSSVDLKANLEVEDEGDIVVGDIATVTVGLFRKNLKEGEAMGPVHAPLFPEPKFEEWWLFLVEAAPATRIIAFERVKDTERHVEEKLRFQISRPGKHNLVLHALCDAYSGIDQKVELNFTALQEDEVKREVFIHKDDEDLDLQPTLFQQFMGDLGKDEESEEEEEDGAKKSKSKPDKAKSATKGKTKAKDLGPRDDQAADDKDDSDSSKDQKKNDDSSGSSSDSD